jgi:hypothetical protein
VGHYRCVFSSKSLPASSALAGRVFDADGGCYVTIFAGPEAEPRARDYFKVLKGKWLRIIRATDAVLSIID